MISKEIRVCALNYTSVFVGQDLPKSVEVSKAGSVKGEWRKSAFASIKFEWSELTTQLVSDSPRYDSQVSTALVKLNQKIR